MLGKQFSFWYATSAALVLTTLSLTAGNLDLAGVLNQNQATGESPVKVDFIRTVAENIAIGAEVGEPLRNEADDIIWRLGSVDTPFDISSRGQIHVVSHLDYEVKTTWTFLVNASNSHGSQKNYRVSVHIQNKQEEPSLFVTPSSGLITSESGEGAEFRVFLRSDIAPTAPVRIPVYSSDPGEGIASVEELVFTPSDWSQPRTVVLSGVNDSQTDGTRNYSIKLGDPLSRDRAFSRLEADEIKVSNLDNDIIKVSPVTGLATTEYGDQATFEIRLNTEPWDEVVIDLSSSNENEGRVFPRQVVFRPDSWDQPKTIIVTGQDDDHQDGEKQFRIITEPATSLDTNYLGLDPDDVIVTNIDNEGAPVSLIQFVSTNYEVIEGKDNAVEIEVKRSGDMSGTVCAGIQVLSGTARENEDFVLDSPNPVVFAHNVASKKIKIFIPNDLQEEGTENFVVELLELAASEKIVIGSARTTITIADDEARAMDLIRLESLQRATIPISFTEHRRNLLEAGLAEEEEPISVQAENLPKGAKITFDARLGHDVLTWSPSAEQVGDHVIKLRALYMYDEAEVRDLHIRVVASNGSVKRR